ncbi:MAG: sigma 54-interacting transcriptional regulator, partial [Candidatus Bathyarchaeota archaeon]|nr:sigma 54-interacting transcriptional regulator [Candidatus Bathyarchaeota archaeon]
RSKKNFVVVDCAALPETLVESVLFGYAKGAFTGADRTQDGLIKQANGGTLFLDEIGELPLSIQKNFLRVLQEHHFRPVGGNREVKSDFRLVAATNRDIDDMVKCREFRDDLLFRLRSLLIELPPLREICEDIKELAMHYLAKLSERHRTGTKGISPEIWDVFANYHWPGNVRELIQALERAIVAAQHEPVLFPKHLPSHIRIQVARASVYKAHEAKERKGEPATSREEFPKLQDLRESAIVEAEQQYLKDLMSITDGNIKRACGMSGISRSRLYALLKKYGTSK